VRSEIKEKRISELYNGSVHRAAANKLNNETRATRGSVCNALLSEARVRWLLAI
jgi:hypothetical protein